MPDLPSEPHSTAWLHPGTGSCMEQAARAQHWTGDAQGCLGVRETVRSEWFVETGGTVFRTNHTTSEGELGG